MLVFVFACVPARMRARTCDRSALRIHHDIFLLDVRPHCCCTNPSTYKQFGLWHASPNKPNFFVMIELLTSYDLIAVAPSCPFSLLKSSLPALSLPCYMLQKLTQGSGILVSSDQNTILFARSIIAMSYKTASQGTPVPFMHTHDPFYFAFLLFLLSRPRDRIVDTTRGWLDRKVP